jgi:hypothetical protein
MAADYQFIASNSQVDVKKSWNLLGAKKIMVYTIFFRLKQSLVFTNQKKISIETLLNFVNQLLIKYVSKWKQMSFVLEANSNNIGYRNWFICKVIT